MTRTELEDLALDYAAAWWRRYENRLVYRPQKWMLNLVAKSMVKAYKKGFYEAKRRYLKNKKHQNYGIKRLPKTGNDDQC